MMPGRYDFTGEHACYRGDTLARTFTWADDAGTAISLSGYTAKMQVLDAGDSVVLEASTANSRLTVTNAAGGVLTLLVAASVIADLTPGKYTYDLQITSSTAVLTLIRGAFHVIKDATE